MNTKQTFAALLLGLTALLCPLVSSAQWEKVNAPYYPGLNQIVRIGDTLYATTAGEVLRSIDRGDSWQKIFEGYELILNPTDQGLYVRGATGDVFGSTDFGHSWQYKFTPPGGNTLVPGFTTDTFFVYDFLKLMRMTAAGWDTVFQLANNGNYVNKIARTGQHLWAATTAGAFHSPDLGETWTQLNFSNSSLAVLGDTVLFSYCISDAYLMRTTDFGASWQSDTFSNPRFCALDATEDAFFSINPLDGNYNIYTSKNGLTDWSVLYTDSLNFIPYSFRSIDNEVFLASPKGLPRSVNGHWIFTQFPKNTVILLGGYKVLKYIDDYLLSTYDFKGFSADKGATWTTSAIGQMPYNVQRMGDSYIGLNSITDATFYKCAADGYFEWKSFPLPFQHGSMTSIGDTIYIVGSTLGQWYLYRSVDGGANWSVSGQSHINNIFSLNGKLLQWGGNGLMSSSDGGANWSLVFDLGEPVTGVYNLQLENGEIYIFNTAEKWVMRSTDAGVSFDTLPLPPQVISGTYFAFKAIGKWNFVTSFNDAIYVKKNDSDTWFNLPLPVPSSEISGIFYEKIAASDDAFFLTGNSGDIWRLDVSQLSEVKGCVYRDDNGNNIQDTGENGIPNVLVKSLSAGFYGTTDTQGKFGFFNNQINDVVKPVTVFPHYSYNPAEIPVQLLDSIPTCFALQTTETVNDLSARLLAQAAFRPGFDNSIFVKVTNEGTTTQAGTLALVLDPLLQLLVNQPPASTITGDTVFWQFAGLAPLTSLTFRTDVQTGITTPGTPVYISASVSGDADIEPLDNRDTLSAAVVASFDPNDKLVRPSLLPAGQATGSEIEYTIRFQNTGNIPTDFVTLRDTLSPFLDPESVRILNTSHPFSWRLERGNILVFDFNPLQLPPLAVDEPGSHGFVQFAVSLKSADAGDSIFNTAYIYFDFNSPIVTNTAQMIIKTIVHTWSPGASENKLSVFPNPASGSVFAEIKGETPAPGVLELFGQSGQLVLRRTTDAVSTEIILPEMPDGHYLLVWRVGERIYSGALTVIKN